MTTITSTGQRSCRSVNEPTEEDLRRWTDDANDYLEANNRQRITPEMVDELYSLGARRCYKCRTVKPLSEFQRNRRNRHGLTSECKLCGRAKDQQWHQENRESELERMRGWYEENKEHVIERMTRWRADNPDYPVTYRLQGQLNDGYRRAVRAGVPAERITQDELLESWKSRGLDPLRSAYSGEPLTVRDRSVDHVIPLSDPQGPGHVVSNLVPCTQKENSTKKQGHFIALLGMIHEHDNKENNQ